MHEYVQTVVILYWNIYIFSSILQNSDTQLFDRNDDKILNMT